MRHINTLFFVITCLFFGWTGCTAHQDGDGGGSSEDDFVCARWNCPEGTVCDEEARGCIPTEEQDASDTEPDPSTDMPESDDTSPQDIGEDNPPDVPEEDPDQGQNLEDLEEDTSPQDMGAQDTNEDPIPCGTANRVCCEGDLCGQGLTCEQGQCVGAGCGAAGQNCCEEGCNFGLVCDQGQCLEVPCGADSQRCCPTGDPCGPGLACSDNQCRSLGQPPAPVGLCEETCQWSNDGECDDGGPNSLYSGCDLGTDCADCGPRVEGQEPSGGEGSACSRS